MPHPPFILHEGGKTAAVEDEEDEEQCRRALKRETEVNNPPSVRLTRSWAGKTDIQNVHLPNLKGGGAKNSGRDVLHSGLKQNLRNTDHRVKTRIVSFLRATT